MELLKVVLLNLFYIYIYIYNSKINNAFKSALINQMFSLRTV